MKKQVPIDSPQWIQVDRKVQLTTGKPSVKLISVYRFDQGNNNNQDVYLRNNKDRNWIDATINITDFSKDYYRQVIEKSIPLEDVIIYTGHVNIHKYSNQPYKIFTFVFCKVLLGNAAQPGTPRMEDCDSIVITPETDEAFQYNFFVKQHWQYQPKYEVNFTVSQDKQFKISQFSCCNCQNRTPTIYCSTQKFYFCEQCSSDHHKTKLMQSHALQPIDKINTLDNCKLHNQKFQLYCLKCEKYLCQLCIQKGVHAKGSDHIVKSIRYYYEELVENIDLLPKKPLEKIEVLLYNLKMKKKQIQDNQKQVRSQIEQQYKKCLKLLQQLTYRKHQLLDSTQLQLNLLRDKINWTQSFSIFQSNAVKPVHFFRSQNIFEEETKKLKIYDFEPILNCKADLVYRGANFVGVKDYIQGNAGIKRQMDEVARGAEGSEGTGGGQGIIKSQNVSGRATQRKKQEQVEKKPDLLSYNPDAIPPPKGSLYSEISGFGLKFFQIKSK